MITGIAAIMLHSPEPAALARWYSENLGVAFDAEEGAWTAWLGTSVMTPRTMFAILPAPGGISGGQQSISLNFQVSDLDQSLATLRSRGAAIERVEQSEFGRIAYLRDLDGNAIELWSEAVPRTTSTQYSVPS